MTKQNANNSPCIRNCCLDEKDICLGCGREISEILEWGKADNHRKAAIKLNAKKRLSLRK